MDIVYFKSQINDELDGAEDYFSKSQDTSNNGFPDSSSTFKEMSKQELGHAKNLLVMMESCMKEMKTIYDTLVQRYHETEDHING